MYSYRLTGNGEFLCDWSSNLIEKIGRSWLKCAHIFMDSWLIFWPAGHKPLNVILVISRSIVQGSVLGPIYCSLVRLTFFELKVTFLLTYFLTYLLTCVCVSPVVLYFSQSSKQKQVVCHHLEADDRRYGVDTSLMHEFQVSTGENRLKNRQYITLQIYTLTSYDILLPFVIRNSETWSLSSALF